MPTVKTVLLATIICLLGQQPLNAKDAPRYNTHVMAMPIVSAANVSFAGSNEHATFLIRYVNAPHAASASTNDTLTLIMIGSTMPRMAPLICIYQGQFVNRSTSRISGTSNAARADRQSLSHTLALHISAIVPSGSGVLKDRRHKGAANHFNRVIACSRIHSASLQLNQKFLLWLTLLPTLVVIVT